MSPPGPLGGSSVPAQPGPSLLDRLSKVRVEQALAGRPPIRVIPGVLSFSYTTNSGGAFGFGRSAPWLFVGATIVVGAVIVVVSTRAMRPSVATWGSGRSSAGRWGTSRIASRTARGSAAGDDFIDFHVWPVFNLADTAIVMGAVVILAGRASFGRDERDGRAARRAG